MDSQHDEAFAVTPGDGAEHPADNASGFFSYTPLTAGMQQLGGGAADDDAAGPNLGADMAEIRARVLGRRAEAAAANADDDEAAATLTAEENREVYEELKKRHQVDLNDEAHASALEDPTLLAHMEAARRRLAEQEKALLRLPRLEDLRANYLKTMGQISGLIRKLEDQHMTERENVEVGYRQGRVLGELLEGRKPHGYPALGAAARADPATKEALGTAATKATKIAQSYETLLGFVEEAKQTLFVLRRQVETVGDGLIELVEASEEDRRRLREYLMMASRTRVVRDSAAPAGTLGERLLAAPVLPEETGLKATEHDEEVTGE